MNGYCPDPLILLVASGPSASPQGIACGTSRSITARDRRRALLGRANAGADGAGPGSRPDTDLCRISQVQDTERQALDQRIGRTPRHLIAHSNAS
jgi:hypothetical protein